MINKVNEIVGSGQYGYDQLVGYFDETIDEINESLYSSLPLVSEIYENTISENSAEELAWMLLDPEANVFEDNSIENPYMRIPDRYLRNYVCYEVAYSLLMSEDEDQEVYYPKFAHSQKWLKRLVAEYSDTTLEDSEVITIGGDAEEVLGVEETEINPYWETE